MQPYTRRQSLPYPAPSSPSFRMNRQGPTTVKLSTPDPTPPSSNPHVPARSNVRLEAGDKDEAAANKAQPLLPAVVSSGSGNNSFLQRLRSRLKSGQKAGRAGGAVPPLDISPSQPQATSSAFSFVDLSMEGIEGIIDPSRLQSTYSPSISGAMLDEASTSGLRTDDRAPIPSSSSPLQPHFGGPVLDDSVVSHPHSMRSREGTVDLRRVSPRTGASAVLSPQLMSPRSGSQDGMASWKAPASWVTGDLPEPDGSSSEDEKALASKRKARRPTVTRVIQSYGTDTHNFKIRVYRANNGFHILTCSLATTVRQLTGKLNATLLGPGEPEDCRLYLEERGRGTFGYFDPFGFFGDALKCICRAYARPNRAAGRYRTKTFITGRLRCS